MARRCPEPERPPRPAHAPEGLTWEGRWGGRPHQGLTPQTRACQGGASGRGSWVARSQDTQRLKDEAGAVEGALQEPAADPSRPWATQIQAALPARWRSWCGPDTEEENRPPRPPGAPARPSQHGHPHSGARPDVRVPDQREGQSDQGRSRAAAISRAVAVGGSDAQRADAQAHTPCMGHALGRAPSADGERSSSPAVR